MNPGDLVEPQWKSGQDWDYFDVLPEGYCTWKKGQLGLVVEVVHKKPKRNSHCTVFFKGRMIIAFLFELNVVSKSSQCQENFNNFQNDLYEDCDDE